jgi:hypothetical protein
MLLPLARLKHNISFVFGGLWVALTVFGARALSLSWCALGRVDFHCLESNCRFCSANNSWCTCSDIFVTINVPAFLGAAA